MSDHRINAVVQVRTRLIKLSADEWTDELLDLEDEILDYLVNNLPDYMSEGPVVVGVFNDPDQAEPHFEFMISNSIEKAIDVFKMNMHTDLTLMNTYTVQFEVLNEGRMASVV